MRYIMMVKTAETGAPPPPELFAAIGKLTDEMTKAGALVASGGLYPSAEGARVQLAGGELAVIDGPFAEAKEVIGGYAIMEAKSKAEAIQLAKQFMQVHADILGPSYVAEVEVRRLFEQ
jgi:hypothetical protein